MYKKGAQQKHTAKQLPPQITSLNGKEIICLVGPPSFLESILVFPLCFVFAFQNNARAVPLKNSGFGSNG